MLQNTIMEKNLAVYPIPNGNELNVFASDTMMEIKIMDMSGVVVFSSNTGKNNCNTINISGLPSATYIVEVAFDNNKTGRSVFVKF